MELPSPSEQLLQHQVQQQVQVDWEVEDKGWEEDSEEVVLSPSVVHRLQLQQQVQVVWEEEVEAALSRSAVLRHQLLSPVQVD